MGYTPVLLINKNQLEEKISKVIDFSEEETFLKNQLIDPDIHDIRGEYIACRSHSSSLSRYIREWLKAQGIEYYELDV